MAVYLDNPQFDQVIVSRLLPGQFEDSAKTVQGIMQDAYVRALEQTDLVAEGFVKQFLFDPTNPDMVAAGSARMRTYAKKGAQYWLAGVVEPGDASPRVVGLAKTSPSRRVPLVGLRKCFINDIAVKEDVEGAGVASALLNTALTDFNGDRAAFLHAFNGNSRANRWFTRIGFSPVAAAIEPFMVGPLRKVPQTLEQAPTVAGVQRRLVATQPWLRRMLLQA